MQKKSIISLILIIAIHLLFLKDSFIVKADFVVPDGGEPWPQGMPNTCQNFSDTFIDFENGIDGQLVNSSVPGVKFTTTEGLDWFYGDIRTENYDVAPYGSQEFVTNDNFFGWMGILGTEGRIDFPQGGASYFSVLVSTSSLLFLIAYDADDNPLDDDWTLGNTNTGLFTRLTVEAPENKKIAYVIISSFGFGNLWLIDDICTDALNVPYFSQCDENWKNEGYDHMDPTKKYTYGGYTAKGTICNWGCGLTSAAMILNYYGVQVNPLTLNQCLIKHKGYTPYGDVKWDKVVQCSNNEVFYYGYNKRNDIILNYDLCNEQPVVLRVPGHFIVATGQAKKDEVDTWTINDPGWENRKDLLSSYNNNYYGMRRYGPRREDNSLIIIRAYSPVELYLIDPQGRRLGVNPNNLGEEYDEIPDGVYYIEDSLIEAGKSTKVIEILNPADGNYELKVVGTGEGSYIIDYDSYDKSGEWIDSKTFKGNAVPGESDVYKLNYSSGSSEEASCFSDSEISQGNTYTTATLDFSWISPGDFSPEVAPTQSSSRQITLANQGSLGFQYNASAVKTGGNNALCNALDLEAKLDGAVKYPYSGSSTGLLEFNLENPVEFSDPENWEFVVTLTSNDPDLQGEICNFNFVFEGSQIGGSGFSDREIIESSVKVGYWDPPVVLNEFLPNAGNYPEFIEIYNKTDSPIDLAGFYITANGNVIPINSSTTNNVYNLNPGSTTIPANGWLVVVPETSNQINDSAGTITLYNPNNIEVDTYSYSAPDHNVNNNPGWTNNLVGYWSFDGSIPNGGSVEDLSGNGNNGTNNGADSTSGKINQGLDFDGSDYVSVLSSGVDFYGKDQITVEAWVYPREFRQDPDHSTIATKACQYYLQVDGAGHLAVYIYGINPAGYHYSDNVIPLDVWTHTVFTYKNGEGFKLYINGNLDKSVPASGTIGGNILQCLGIGANLNSACDLYSGYERKFNGIIDEVKIYDRALDADEILEHYNDATPTGEVPEDKSYARIPDGSSDWVDPIPTPGTPNKLSMEESMEEFNFNQSAVFTKEETEENSIDEEIDEEIEGEIEGDFEFNNEDINDGNDKELDEQNNFFSDLPFQNTDNNNPVSDDNEFLPEKVLITKKIRLDDDDEIVSDDDNGSGNDLDSGENGDDEDGGNGNNSSSGSKFVDSVQPPGGYHLNF